MHELLGGKKEPIMLQRGDAENNSYKKVCIGLFVFAKHGHVKTHNITENAEEVSQENVYPLLHDLQDNGKENLL